MRLALLGSDHEIQALLRDLPADSGHTIVAAFDADENKLPLGALLSHVERGDNWQSLLVRDDIDLVIVASAGNLRPTADRLDPQVRRIDQLKKLAQAGVNLLISHPAADLLDAYEIEMLRREGGGCIVPWFPGLYHPAWEELPRLQAKNENGAITSPPVQITWERRLAVRTRDHVLAAVARDLFLISRVVGKLKRVTALGGSAEGNAPQAWQSFTLQVEAEDQSLVRWSIAPSTAPCSIRAWMNEGDNPWELRAPADLAQPWLLSDRGEVDPGEMNWSDAAETFATFERIRTSPNETVGAWLEACQSLETLAAVEKSVQRSRTIELSQAEQSEEHNFKGVMASAGCLLLMISLGALFVVALVEGLQLPLRNSTIWRLWPLALVLPMAAFLGLQFLQTVIQKPQQR